MWKAFFGGCVFLCAPSLTQAAITISEVAWMGSAESANHEWIELHNDGSATDVSGWVLSDGMNMSIELLGIIPARTHVVLERTSDASAPGVAFLIYTGALVNTGATLRLETETGSLVDQVSGGEDWQNIGGDNVTKETAQYTTGGWVTAVATPGRGITADEVTASNAANQKESSKVAAGGKVATPVQYEPVALTLPGVTLALSVSAPSLGYVHQPIDFFATPSGIGNALIQSLQYEWNFGDGTTAQTQETTHVYEYPGTYVVTVYAEYKRQEQVARHEITILPVAVSITMNREGDVQVNNDSPYELDISGYRVKADQEFVFPPRTILLPNQTITIPRQKLGATKSRLVSVYDAASALLASSLPPMLQSPISVARDVTPQTVADTFLVPGEIERQISENSLPDIAESLETDQVILEERENVTEVNMPGITVAAAAEAEMAAVGAASQQLPERWPYLALAVVLLVATLSVYATPRRQPEE